MSNSKKLLIAVVLMLTIGAGTAFALWWSGTGTGTCTDGEYEFHPFREWEGRVLYDTTQTPWVPYFCGWWWDTENDETGGILGNWYDPAPPPSSSNHRTSEGEWYRDSIIQTEVWGTYTIDFIVYPYCVCSGTWTTTKDGWSGSGTISGSDPDCPPH